METKQENNNTNQGASNSTGMNIPEWVMHLLTGLGTMGAEYMLFIKPLQEKMELQIQLIKNQEDRIKQLEIVLKGKRIKLKSSTEDIDEEEDDEEEQDEETELFQLKRKPAVRPKYRKYSQVKL